MYELTYDSKTFFLLQRKHIGTCIRAPDGEMGKRRKRVQILYMILTTLSESKHDIYRNRFQAKLKPGTRFTGKKCHSGADQQFTLLLLLLALGCFQGPLQELPFGYTTPKCLITDYHAH